MSFTLVYLTNEYSYSFWAFWAFTALNQEAAESIACQYCNRSGFTFADLLVGEN